MYRFCIDLFPKAFPFELYVKTGFVHGLVWSFKVRHIGLSEDLLLEYIATYFNLSSVRKKARSMPLYRVNGAPSIYLLDT